MKLLHLELKRCDDCPYCYCDVDLGKYYCRHSEGRVGYIATERQWQKQKKINIPKDCPLPEKSK